MTKIIKGSELADRTLEVLDNGLLKIVEKLKPKKFEPVLGEFYWFVDDKCLLNGSNWEDSRVDNWRFRNMNLFKFGKEVDLYRDYLERRDALSRPFEEDKNNYCFITAQLGDEKSSLRIDDYISLQYPGTTYFEYKEDAQKLIDEFGEECILAWEFGVYEDE